MNKKTAVNIKTEDQGQEGPSVLPQFEVLTNLQRQIDALFEDFSRDWPTGRFSRLSHLFPRRFGAEKHAFTFPQLPACEVIDKPAEVVVRAEIPGIALEDVELTLGKDVLTLHGEKKEEKQTKEDGYVLAERSYGTFHRAIPIPDNVDRDAVSAEYKDGVMTVHLPKTTQTKEHPRKVSVRAG